MNFIPERLKSARMMSGISLQGLADKLKELGNSISKQGISKYEQGDSNPNSEMVGLLSNILGVRPDYFYNDFNIEFAEIEYRKLQSYSSKESQRIVEISRDALRRYLELEELLNIETKFINPLVDFKITDLESVNNAADELRKIWKLGINPIPNTIELLEDHHVKVIEIESDVKLDGFSTIANKKYPLVILNKTKLDDKADRKRWTALHELGHLVLNIDDLDEKTKEKYCHHFAGALLFPKEVMFKELGERRSRLSINELGALKEVYGISMQAIVYRAKDVEIISESTYKQFFYMFNKMGHRKDEPYEYNGYEGSNRFRQLLFRALAEEIISMSKAATLNNQKLAEFRQENLVI
ncbi:MAG: XRE family transcriptional regulator [Cyclobacteriaceae bacterium]|nr:XRE family transcriptional regulator [Cyclobacteriaceae bacterium]